jgi:uncharacterized protein DUF4167
LINNRQGGRRRGRGGQGGQGGQGGRNIGGQPGNRQDNRQRGNAAQLHEKYKSMARDSQLAGDRVQTEYYLQFADHYFRVLGESRSRFDEQRPQRGDGGDDDDGDEQFADNDSEAEAPADNRGEREDQRPDRGERFNNRQRRPRRDEGEERSSRPAPAQAEHVNGGETIAFDVLPPAIGRDESEQPAEEEKPRPRRRARAARPAGDEDEVAPAA